MNNPMWQRSRASLCVLCMVTLMEGVAEEGEGGYPTQPVPFTDVEVTDGFWSRRLAVNRTVSLPHALQQCEETGRIKNFKVADSVLSGIIKKGSFCTRYGFDDSDVFKTIEGAAYILQSDYDSKLDLYVDSLIATIAGAQEGDGYLYTMRTIHPEASWAKERWVNARPKYSHELYNAGHLYEAAVAHYQATGKKTLLHIALKSADLLVETFGPEKMRTVPGHQEIEIGLVKLHLLTGKTEYLDLARYFLEERGHGVTEGRTYNQDHRPVVEQTEAVGHAVRAGYMYTAMADIAALTGDDRYGISLERIWDNVIGKKLYLTGGVGSAGNIEGFGEAYDLPNFSAYCETCAAIAMVFWNHRMFLQQGDAKYMDVVERVLYNGFLSGVSMSGDRFFYVNPLESYAGAERAPWFRCACCPPNIVRFIPTLGRYVYATGSNDLYVNLFVGSTASLTLGSRTVIVRQKSGYPWDGRISITVDPEEPAEFTLRVRIPGWAKGAPVPSDLYRYLGRENGDFILLVNGDAYDYERERGFAVIQRRWSRGDHVELDVPMPVRRVVANESVEDDRGRVAFERGPVLFCLEGADNGGGKVWSLVVPDTATLRSEYRAELLGGVHVIRGSAFSVRRAQDGEMEVDGPDKFTAVPYYAWAHRGPYQMAVWATRELPAARPLPAPTIAYRSTLTTSGGKNRAAIADQLLPKGRYDNSVPYFHWWPRRGSQEWVQFDLPDVM
ncbi:MAG: glycoside hydrolase family 127 protein, partial [Bacteroidota bacterium]